MVQDFDKEVPTSPLVAAARGPLAKRRKSKQDYGWSSALMKDMYEAEQDKQDTLVARKQVVVGTLMSNYRCVDFGPSTLSVLLAPAV